MEKVILDGKELDIKVELKEGKIKLEAVYDGAQADAGAFIVIGVEELLDKLEEKIPGKIDAAIFAVIKAALKAA
jgi:hypothetical protein